MGGTIDMAESLATHHDWDYERLADDQITMAIEGQWREYSLTLAWSPCDQTLRLILTFDIDPPEDRMSELFALSIEHG